MQVPFVDLKAQYLSIKPEIGNAINEVLETCSFVQGNFVSSFEKKFLKVHGGNYGVGCSNGTSAITVSLRALGIKKGDEVITVANTFFATLEAICEVGATPVLVDCLEDSYLIDCEKVEEAISSKTKAIIPVHLYGNSCDMERISKIAKQYNLKVIEDCAQAHLSHFNKKAVGTFCDAATFSFYPGKNLGAYGDAGFIIAKDEALEKLVRMHVNHGRVKKYEHDFVAGNFRMDGIQGAVLNVKLDYIRKWTDARQSAAAKYSQKFKEAGFKIIEQLEGGECVYHLFVIEVSNRNEVMEALKEKGISTGIHYPVPMHLQPALSFLGYKKGHFPVCENAADRIMSLPIFPEITNEQIEYVISEFLKVAKK